MAGTHKKVLYQNDFGICLSGLANKSGLLFYSSPFFVAYYLKMSGGYCYGRYFLKCENETS